MLVIMTYEDEDDAIRIANGTQYGLSAGVWSTDPARAQKIARRIRSGQVRINDGTPNPLARFGRRINILLWAQAEVVAMSTDLAEFTGAAIGLHLLLGLALLPAGGVTTATAFVILALERRGHRPFELAVASLLSLVGLGVAHLFFLSEGNRTRGSARACCPI